ncbi:hypothetical protein BCV70DRAFT_202408 [Testicularia cyperi]|uniref:Uncharacterized protein n=1 Tax=Testicularia cyperi TaxID=1882483 RepID=A0A317XJG2_9BASI|nr:hypothetical protein BCV70DRAFT_202408 [Testicularia cyperi]
MSASLSFRPLLRSAKAVGEVGGGVVVVHNRREPPPLGLERRFSLQSGFHSTAHRPCTSTQPHAPHGRSLLGVAGPSRCFCSSHSQHKVSDLPLDSFHHTIDHNTYDTTSTNGAAFWTSSKMHGLETSATTTASPNPPTTHATSSVASSSDPICDTISRDRARTPTFPSQRAAPPASRPSRLDTANDDHFFTSISPSTSVADPSQSATAQGKRRQIHHDPLYVDLLSPEQKAAFLDHALTLIRSGERSLPVIARTMSTDLTADQEEQLACIVLLHCRKHDGSAALIWDLYEHWAQAVDAPYVPPPGPARIPMRQLQAKTLYVCCMLLQSAGWLRQAAIVSGDPRLKASQSRSLLERIVFDLNLSEPAGRHSSQAKTTDCDIYEHNADPTTQPLRSFADHSSARHRNQQLLALRAVADTMSNLLADGIVFKTGSLQRTLKMLCAACCYGHALRLVRLAQRRAQLDLLQDGGSNSGRLEAIRTAGGFSRMRAEPTETPPILPVKAMEQIVHLLCSQNAAGAKAAFELVQSLPASQRTRPMYDVLMRTFGHVSIKHPKRAVQQQLPEKEGSTKDNGNREESGQAGYVSNAEIISHQLWNEQQSTSHLGPPSLHTISHRIHCHADNRRLDLIRRDLEYLRKSKLGNLHDLTTGARLAVVRCCIETGYLKLGFRFASKLIESADSDGGRTAVLNAVLRAALRMRLDPPTDSPGKGADGPLDTASDSESARLPDTSASASALTTTPSPAIPRQWNRRKPSWPSRAQLLKRFLQHYSRLHRKFPELHPNMDSLNLFVQLLTRGQGWIETPALWSMLHVVSGHFPPGDERLVPVLQAFATVFANRNDSVSANETRRFLGLYASSSTTEA